MFDRYRLVRPLGRGGHATVWQAMEGGAPLALKVMDAQPDRESLEAWVREVDHGQQVLSPGVVRILRSGFAHGRYFLAMELLRGRPLNVLLAERGPAPADVVGRLGAGLARALADVHARGLVHRDVSPANIMVEEHRPVLLDFGLSRAAGPRPDNELGTVLGTLQFLAPELLGGAADYLPSADVFGLGCVLYEMLSGRRPYRAAPARDLVLRRLAGEVPPALDDLVPGAPPRLVALIRELMLEEPTYRPDAATAAAQLGALQEPGLLLCPWPARRPEAPA